MLYITTRDDRDAHTAHKALCYDTGTDGGLYIPFRLPQFDFDEIFQMKDRSFGEVTAQILNLFFSAQLTGWDVDFCIGRNPTQTVPVGRKAVIAELWHNPRSGYDYIVKDLYSRLRNSVGGEVSNWGTVAVRVAVVFACYAQMLRSEQIQPGIAMDIAVPVNNLNDAMAVLYAKKMGLPVNNVILCTDDNSALWDLIHRGEVSTSLLPPDRKLGLERLIAYICGVGEVARYRAACDKHGVYTPSEVYAEGFSNGLFGAVVGKERVSAVINSIYRTNHYVIDPRTAVCYGGLQDYRSRTGESRLTLIFADEGPALYAKEVQNATGLTQEFVSAFLKKG